MDAPRIILLPGNIVELGRRASYVDAETRASAFIGNLIIAPQDYFSLGSPSLRLPRLRFEVMTDLKGSNNLTYIGLSY
jgi:hypothetical protein